jgi:hypothetical protein
VIWRRDSHTELPVDLAEGANHGGLLTVRRPNEGKKDHAGDDTPEPAGVIPLQVGLTRLLQDLQDAPEMLFADQDLVLGIHVADPAVDGGNDSDVRSCVAKGSDYVINVIEDLGFQIVSPAVRFGHDALRKS